MADDTKPPTIANRLSDQEMWDVVLDLSVRCKTLEARMAALAAFTCTLLEGNSRRDELMSRWVKHLAPALKEFSGVTPWDRTMGSTIPAWVSHRLDGDPDLDGN